jgi:hypothetical protein
MLGFSDMPTDFFMPSFHGLFFLSVSRNIEDMK